MHYETLRDLKEIADLLYKIVDREVSYKNVENIKAYETYKIKERLQRIETKLGISEQESE